jgi:hypothetical protein
MRLPLFRCFAAVVAVLVAPLVQAQPLVDGVSVGVGLSSYHGDLDWNPDTGPAEFLAASNLGAFVAADRAFGPIVTEGVLQVKRIAIDFPGAEMAINMLALDLTSGPRFDLFRPGLLRFYAGVSPALLLTNYHGVDEARLGDYEFDEQPVRFLVTFPVGVVIQDVLRIGVRVIPSDNFDSITGLTNNVDLLTSVSVGYRFDLLKPSR